MNNTRSLAFIASLFMMIFILPSCSEKEDFIPEPTETSVIITGTVTTSSGKPLANLPVYVDYHEGYPLGQQTTLHKAKGMTDAAGHYRLFFEPEPDKSNDPGQPTQVYYLCADLGDLSPNEYIMPSDINDNMKDIYRLGIYKHLEQGESLEIDMLFPKRKELVTELKNFIGEKRLTVENSIIYGADKVEIRRNVDVDADGNGSFSMPYSMNESNLVTVFKDNSFQQLMKPQEITVTDDTQSAVIFDNNETFENAKFKLSLYTHTAFNGDKYGDAEAFRTPAPFDFLGFRIVNKDGNYEFPTNRYQYYDSIVWSSPDFSKTVRIYERKQSGSGSSEHLTSQWGSYFFKSGIHKTVLTGYKNGEAIYSDEEAFELKDRDFLCFDWDHFDYLTDKGVAQNIYSMFDDSFSYKVNALKESDGSKLVKIFVHFRDSLDKETQLNWEEARLSNLMTTHLGHWIEYDKATLPSLFKHLPADHLLGKLFENTTTRAIVVLCPATEFDPAYYYIHAEPKN